MRLCFLHGLDSSPQGTKARLLKTHYPDCLIPTLPPDIHERVRILEQMLCEPMFVIGSSLGGLTALMFAMKRPTLIKAMLLLAPAVGCNAESLFSEQHQSLLDFVFIPKGIPTNIIAGTKDEVIPLSAIRALKERSPDPARIRLHEVDDDHNLHQSLDLMLAVIEQLRNQIS